MATAAANRERYLADKAQGLPVCSLNIAETFQQLSKQESASAPAVASRQRSLAECEG